MNEPGPAAAVGNTQWSNTGQVVQSGGGGYYSVLDMKRAAVRAGRTPYAEYPDGYLGNSNSRNQDKLLNEVGTRLTQRNYQRGVHKGDRIDPQDYLWNAEFNDQSGITAEAEGLKWTALGSTPETILTAGRNAGNILSPEQIAKVANGLGVVTSDPIRSARMRPLLPNWS